MINILLSLLIIAVIIGLVIYVADNLLPDPFNKVVKVVAVVIGCIALILILLRVLGIDPGVPVQ